ncbi:MAG: winged helix-turn-helix domain-containing protein [Actinomycetota bacterium]
MTVLVLLSDRSPEVALPALAGGDLKVEPLSRDVLPTVLGLAPTALLLDAGEHPAQAHSVLVRLRELDPRVPAVVVLERGALEAFPWADWADELVYAGAPAAEVRVRLAMLRRRAGVAEAGTIRLGPLALDPVAYQATVEGRALDLTYKEFALLRFLAERPWRVCTRPDLLREVWGYDFYGGTRTVDVHVRRLRAKLGPAHEGLVETIRGVGYRAVDAPAAGRGAPVDES